MLPVLIWFAMSCTALRPDEQKRFTEEAPVVLGNPAARAAVRTVNAALPSLTYFSCKYNDVRMTEKLTFPMQMSSTT